MLTFPMLMSKSTACARWFVKDMFRVSSRDMGGSGR